MKFLLSYCSYALSPEMSRPWARLRRSGVKVGHEGVLCLGTGFPSEAERGHEVAQLLAIENHALEDAVVHFNKLLPFSVRRYFWRRLVGLSGRVGSMNPCESAGWR